MIEFAKHVYPGFKVGPHHRKLAKIFQDVIDGKKKRVIINIAPRMGKSEFSSYLFPGYFLGNYPEKKIIMGTHTAGLSEDFGRRVRNLLEDEQYHEAISSRQAWQMTRRLLENGVLVLGASIMLLAWVALWLGVVLTYLLSTTLTRNKT
jgi:hypothetical protein